MPELLISVKNVKYAYNFEGASPVVAVNNVSFDVAEGEFIALVGHNGSGKSTVAKMLNGLIIPNFGDVEVSGLNTREEKNHFEIRKNVGVVFQNPDNQMIATIIEDDVAFGPENLGLSPAEIRERVDWALACVGMSDYAKKTPHRLSGGQKQRVAIAGVLAIKPRVLVLDEATSMLDPQGRKEVMEVISRLNREQGMAVVMITHYMEEAVSADKILVVNKTKLAASGGRELFLREEELKGYGLDVPIAASMANELRANGLGIDGALNTEEFAEAVCRSLSKN
jgi:energy-coupling factor transport system ATP-binding protein